MAASGIPVGPAELSDIELGYIGGLLKLDLIYDQEGTANLLEQANSQPRRGPSPERKG